MGIIDLERGVQHSHVRTSNCRRVLRITKCRYMKDAHIVCLYVKIVEIS